MDHAKLPALIETMGCDYCRALATPACASDKLPGGAGSSLRLDTKPRCPLVPSVVTMRTLLLQTMFTIASNDVYLQDDVM